MALSLEHFKAILDGDTVDTRDGERVRLSGYNAPEVAHEEQGTLAEPGAALSTAYTQAYLEQPGAVATPQGTDRYGRTLADVRIPGQESLAEGQLRQGLATPMSFQEGGEEASRAQRRAYLAGLRERNDPSTPEQAAINERLNAEWRSAVSDRPNVRMQQARDTGDVFSDAIGRGLDQVGLMVGGAQRWAGQALGIEALEAAGDKRIASNKLDVSINRPDIGTLDNIENVGDGMTYVVEKLGEQAPNIGVTLGMAAATGGTGAALRMASAKLASEKLAVQTAASAMGVLGKGMTSLTGAGAGALTLNLGESKLNLDEVDPNGDHNLLALTTGLAKTVLDVGALAAIPGIGRMLMPQAKRLGLSPKEALTAGGQIPAAIARSAAIEGGTEAVQGLLDEAATKYKYGRDINWQNVLESGAVGLITGGAMGGIGGAAEVGLNKALQPPETPPGASDPGGTTPPHPDPVEGRTRLAAIQAQMEELGRQAGALPEGSEALSQIELDMQALGEEALALQEGLRAGTTPEPEADLAAQMAAAADPNHPKPGVWIAGGGMAEARQARQAGLDVVTLDDGNERGLFASADPALRQKLYDLTNAGMPIGQALAENLYNIPAQTKPAAVDAAAQGADVPVVQNVTPEGAVVTEAVTPPDQLQDTQNALAEQLGAGETQRVVSATEAQTRRAEFAEPAESIGEVLRRRGRAPQFYPLYTELKRRVAAAVAVQPQDEGARAALASELEQLQRAVERLQNTEAAVPLSDADSVAELERRIFHARQRVDPPPANERAFGAVTVDSEQESSAPTGTQPVEPQERRMLSQGIRPAAPRPGVRVDAGGNVDVVTDPNANLVEGRSGEFVGPPTMLPTRAGAPILTPEGKTVPGHIAHRQMADANADAAQRATEAALAGEQSQAPVKRGVAMPEDEQGNPILEASGPAGIQIVELPFGENPPKDVVDGHRYQGKSILNSVPGERGWLGNPFVASDVRGGKISRAEAVAKYKEALYARASSDPAFAAALQRLRGKKVGYYKPGEQDIHLQAIDQWHADNPAPNQTTMVPAQYDIPTDQNSPPQPTAVPEGGTRVVYGKPNAPAQRAASIVDGAPVTDRMSRHAQRGKRVSNAPADTGSGLQRLAIRLRQLPYVKRLMLLASRDRKHTKPLPSTKVKTASGVITVADRNDQILNLVRDALLAHLDRVHGVQGESQRRQGTTLGIKYGALLHQIASNVPDSVLNDFVEAAHNDKRNTLNAVGRPQGVSQDRSVGQAQQGRTLQDDDNGRAVEGEQYAGEEVEYEEGFSEMQDSAPARQALREFLAAVTGRKGILTEPTKRDAGGQPTNERWSVREQFMELRRNPIFRSDTPAQIAERFNEWARKTGKTLADFVDTAHKAYLKDPTGFGPGMVDDKIFEASSTAARQFEAAVQASPYDATVDRVEQRDLADFGVERDLNNAIDLNDEQAGYDREQQAARQARGVPAERVPKTEREVSRLRGTIENKVNLDAAEGDGLTADPDANPVNSLSRTLSDLLFGDLAPVADLLNGLRNKTGSMDADTLVAMLLRSGKPSKVTRLLLGALRPHLKGYTLRFDPQAADPGAIDTSGKTITIDSRLRTAEMLHVMLHEMVHAATAGSLRSNARFAAEVGRLRAIAAEQFGKSPPKDAEDAREVAYGLSSNDEFVAQLFSSPAFVDFLENITDPADPRRTGRLATVLNQILQALKKALGLDTNVTLAGQAMDTVLQQIVTAAPTDAAGANLNAISVRPLAEAIRNAGPVQSVANAPQGAKLRTLGRELVTGTGKAGRFLARATQAFLSTDWQWRQFLPKEIADRLYIRPGERGEAGFFNRINTSQRAYGTLYENLVRRLENKVVNGKKLGKDGAYTALADAWGEIERANQALAEQRRRAAELRRQGKPVPAESVVALSDDASALQELFARYASYIESSGVRGFRRVGNGQYFLPHMYDRGEIKARFDEFVTALVGLEVTDPRTQEVSVLDRPSARRFAESVIQEHSSNSYADIPWAGSLKNRTLTDAAAAQKLRDAGFMNNNIGAIIQYYVDSVVKAAEFEKTFGGYAYRIQRDGWGIVVRNYKFDPDHKLIRRTLSGMYGIAFNADASSTAYQQAFDRAVRDGLIEPAEDAPGQYKVWQRDFKYQTQLLAKIKEKHDRQRFQLLFSGAMGNLGGDMNPQWRRTQQWLLMSQSITTLAFSTLSSLPELGVLASSQAGLASFRDGMRAVITDRKAAFELLRDIGLSGEHAAHIAMADPGVMNAGEIPRTVMDKFFKLNGQHYWTQFLRAIAVQMFKTSAERFVADGKTGSKFFDHYGLTREDVSAWLVDGMPAFTYSVDPDNMSRPHPVAMAVHRFVDEHVAVPNNVNVPAFFNDPRFALVVQLKRFFYAYGGQVMMRMVREARTNYQAALARGDAPGAAAVVAAFPYMVLGVFSMPLAMLAGELKDFIKWDAWGETKPAYDDEGLAYAMRMFRSTGALGPADLAISLFDERSGGMESVMGPIIAHIDVGLEHGFFSEQFLRRSTPVLGQMNGLWK